MYSIKSEIKDTSVSDTSVSYRDKISTSQFNLQRTLSFELIFHITNFPFLSSIIQSSAAYGVFITQRKQYARACSYDLMFYYEDRI